MGVAKEIAQVKVGLRLRILIAVLGLDVGARDSTFRIEYGRRAAEVLHAHRVAKPSRFAPGGNPLGIAAYASAQAVGVVVEPVQVQVIAELESALGRREDVGVLATPDLAREYQDAVPRSEAVAVAPFVRYIERAAAYARRFDLEFLIRIDRRLHPLLRNDDAFDGCGVIEFVLRRPHDRIARALLGLAPGVVFA